MNQDLISQLIKSLIRFALVAGGSWLAKKGVDTQNVESILMGMAPMLAALAWSVAHKISVHGGGADTEPKDARHGNAPSKESGTTLLRLLPLAAAVVLLSGCGTLTGNLYKAGVASEETGSAAMSAWVEWYKAHPGPKAETARIKVDAAYSKYRAAMNIYWDGLVTLKREQDAGAAKTLTDHLRLVLADASHYYGDISALVRELKGTP